jgi:hypothetical protein
MAKLRAALPGAKPMPLQRWSYEYPRSRSVAQQAGSLVERKLWVQLGATQETPTFLTVGNDDGIARRLHFFDLEKRLCDGKMQTKGCRHRNVAAPFARSRDLLAGD